MALQAVKAFRHREIISVLRGNSQLSQGPLKVPNPFIPRLNPETGRWAPAKYSLRRQAELINKARESNTLHLLPPGPKFGTSELHKAIQGTAATENAPSTNKPDVLAAQIVWEGEVKERKVPGADIGNRLYAGKKRMFKGHKWERVQEKVTQKREFLLKNMPERIQRFKSIYSRKRPSPLSPPRVSAKAAKLPF